MPRAVAVCSGQRNQEAWIPAAGASLWATLPLQAIALDIFLSVQLVLLPQAGLHDLTVWGFHCPVDVS